MMQQRYGGASWDVTGVETVVIPCPAVSVPYHTSPACHTRNIAGQTLTSRLCRHPGTATADEILAKVALTQTNIRKLVDNNAK
jgi:hypothetical protein